MKLFGVEVNAKTAISSVRQIIQIGQFRISRLAWFEQSFIHIDNVVAVRKVRMTIQLLWLGFRGTK